MPGPSRLRNHLEGIRTGEGLVGEVDDRSHLKTDRVLSCEECRQGHLRPRWEEEGSESPRCLKKTYR